jgi:hypothetical protein
MIEVISIIWIFSGTNVQYDLINRFVLVIYFFLLFELMQVIT